MCFDATEVCPPLDTPRAEFLPQGDRGDGQRVVLGSTTSSALAELRLFMIGCGAIGCEMIKNYALLGVATGEQGMLTVTDNDLIEKSNLNRQFLFRPQHIQQPKSTTAARAALAINPVCYFFPISKYQF
jgi:ubiquitin-activating enzyme E1-like protein 2